MSTKLHYNRRQLLQSTFGLLGVQLAAQTPAPVSERAVLRIAREVQRAVLTLPNYGLFDNITFGIRGYEVILKGQASRPTLKSSVEQVVKKIEGVEKVTNQIEVLPLSRFDDEVRIRVYAAIYGNPSLSRYNPNRGTPLPISSTAISMGIVNDPPPGHHPIHILVKNGQVTLEGVVDNVADRTIAEIQANSTPNVFQVTNNLRLANQEQESLMKSGSQRK